MTKIKRPADRFEVDANTNLHVAGILTQS